MGLVYTHTHAALLTTLRSLEDAGHDEDAPPLDHDVAISLLRGLAADWTLRDAADAWVAGLWSAPFGWRTALTGKVIGAVVPDHAMTPYGGSASTCTECGQDGSGLNGAEQWALRHHDGAPIDAHIPEHVHTLEGFSGQERPAPTEYDLWALRAVLTVIRALPPATRYSQARDALKKAAILPTSKVWAYQSLLEELALVGILASDEHPGMLTRWSSYAERDRRPNVRVEVQAPLAWWDSSVGIRQEALKAVFGHLDLSDVDLDAPRPTPSPERKLTVTGAPVARRRSPATVPPSVGEGQAEAGDVYALHLADEKWATVYVHGEALTEPRRYVYAEFLEGLHDGFPEVDALGTRVRPRRDGRSAFRVHSLEKLPRCRRIARGVASPLADEPFPDGTPTGNASDFRSMAGWFWKDLD